MDLNLTDLYYNAHLLTLAVVGFALLLVEATKKSRAEVSFWVGCGGLVVVLGLTLGQLDGEVSTFHRMLQSGGYAAYFSIVVVVATLLTVLLSRQFLSRMQMHYGEFYALLVFACMGMILMASALDLIVVFLGIELMSVCLYVLAGFFRSREPSNESGLKYFLLGAFATGFLLYGIALIYGATGTTNLHDIRDGFASFGSSPLLLIGAGMLIVAFSFKVAAVPFHMWAPDVYQGAPTTVTAFMSTAAKAAAFAAFISVFVRFFDFDGTKVSEVIAFIAAASMIVGNISAVVQSSVKRMLAYSSIAHAGYMLSGVAAGSPEGQSGILYYLVAYTFMNIGAFGILSMMEKEGEKGLSYDEYAGLSSSRPFLAALLALFMFSLAGIPPFAGFFGKYYVFLAAVKADLTWLAIVGVVTSVISAYYYLKLVILMYFREGMADVPALPSRGALFAVSLSALLVVQLGVYPSLIVEIIHQLH